MSAHAAPESNDTMKREYEQDDVEYEVVSDGARNIASRRGKFHTAVGKYAYTGGIAKETFTSTVGVIVKYVNEYPYRKFQ